MGCNDDGDLTEEAIRKSSYSTDVFVRNVGNSHYMDILLLKLFILTLRRYAANYKIFKLFFFFWLQQYITTQLKTNLI